MELAKAAIAPAVYFALFAALSVTVYNGPVRQFLQNRTEIRYDVMDMDIKGCETLKARIGNF